MPFLTPIDLRPYRNNTWVVLSKIVWTHPDFGTITIPHGFITDLASTPQILHSLPWFDPSGEGRWGALPHDYLYTSHRLQWRDVADGEVWGHAETRLWCDRVLRQALIDGGMSPWLAQAYFLGVRLGGWLPWD